MESAHTAEKSALQQQLEECRANGVTVTLHCKNLERQLRAKEKEAEHSMTTLLSVLP